jgi:hypothetical protein
MDRHDEPIDHEGEARAMVAAGRCPECLGWTAPGVVEPRCHCEEDGRPNATDRALAKAIERHVRECLDLKRDGLHTVTVGFDVPKPATPYDLDRVVDLVRASLTICQVHTPWYLKDGIEVQTFEDEGPEED